MAMAWKSHLRTAHVMLLHWCVLNLSETTRLKDEDEVGQMFALWPLIVFLPCLSDDFEGLSASLLNGLN